MPLFNPCNPCCKNSSTQTCYPCNLTETDSLIVDFNFDYSLFYNKQYFLNPDYVGFNIFPVTGPLQIIENLDYTESYGPFTLTSANGIPPNLQIKPTNYPNYYFKADINNIPIKIFIFDTRYIPGYEFRFVGFDADVNAPNYHPNIPFPIPPGTIPLVQFGQIEQIIYYCNQLLFKISIFGIDDTFKLEFYNLYASYFSKPYWDLSKGDLYDFTNDDLFRFYNFSIPSMLSPFTNICGVQPDIHQSRTFYYYGGCDNSNLQIATNNSTFCSKQNIDFNITDNLMSYSAIEPTLTLTGQFDNSVDPPRQIQTLEHDIFNVTGGMSYNVTLRIS